MRSASCSQVALVAPLGDRWNVAGQLSSWRLWSAVASGRLVTWVSRCLRIGHGTVIGGRVALAIDPRVLRRLTVGRPVTVITGTNGKTTTTLLAATALASTRTVSATSGANMTAGLVTAAARPSEELVLEVDELYVARTLDHTRPIVLVLLNLSRDQLDRMVEIRRIAIMWREAIAAATWPMTIVANADDPTVVWAVGDHLDVVWVAAGYGWQQDGMLCPSCGHVRHLPSGGSWSCTCGLSRPAADWTFTTAELRGPTNAYAFQPRLPGEMNRSNAAVAIAIAAARGVGPSAALAAVERVDSVVGRYRVVDVEGRRVRLLLAKNPASWAETLRLLDAGRGPIVICVNARGPDGRDTSWLWDVPFERLAARTVAASGERRLDLALRLQTAGIDCLIVADGLDAVRSVAGVGEAVDLVGTYTAFHEMLDRLHVRW